MSPNECSQICPALLLVELISKKWVLLIIKSIAGGNQCYSNIEKDLGGINPSILSSRLKELQEAGFINKEIIGDTPIKIQYTLSKKGQSFAPLLDQIVDWAKQWK